MAIQEFTGELDAVPSSTAVPTGAKSAPTVSEFTGDLDPVEIQPLTSDARDVGDNGVGKLHHAASVAGQSFADVPASLLKTTAVLNYEAKKKAFGLYDKIDAGKLDINRGMYPPEVYSYYRATPEVRSKMRSSYEDAMPGKDPRASDTYQLGQSVDEYWKKELATNPKYKDSFLLTSLPQGIGSSAGFAAFAPLGVAGVMAAGAGAQGSQGFEDALQHGASIEDAYKSANLNAMVGTSEALPISHILSRADKYTGGGIKRLILDALKSGTEEGLQEMGQQLAQNLIASKVVKYNPDQDTWEGVDSNTEVGFTTGALMQVLASMVHAKFRPAAIKTEGRRPDESNDGLSYDTNIKNTRPQVINAEDVIGKVEPEEKQATSQQSVGLPTGKPIPQADMQAQSAPVAPISIAAPHTNAVAPTEITAQESSAPTTDPTEIAPTSTQNVTTLKVAPKKQSEKTPDDLLKAISRAGGLDRAHWGAQGIDKAHFNDPMSRQVFGKPLFPKQGGMTADGLAEFLSQRGFMPEGQYDANHALELVSRALSGQKIYSMQDAGKAEDIRRNQELADKSEDTNRIQEHNAKATELDDMIPTDDDLFDSGYQHANIPTQDLSAVMTRGISAMGSDAFDSFYESFTRRNSNLSDNDFETALNNAIEEHANAKSESRQTEGSGNSKEAAQEDAKTEGNQGRAGTRQGASDSQVTNDLFGGKTDGQQAIHDARIAKDKKRNGTEHVAVESGAGDLFSGKSKQTDIEDVAKAKEDGDARAATELLSEIEEDISNGRGHADLLPVGIGKFSEILKEHGWTEGKNGHWTKGDGTLFIRSQGNTARPIVQWSKADVPRAQAATESDKPKSESSKETAPKGAVSDFADRSDKLIEKWNGILSTDQKNGKQRLSDFLASLALGRDFNEDPAAYYAREGLTKFVDWASDINTGRVKFVPDTKAGQEDTNKVFTKKAADDARARLKAKLGQLNSGLDPELMRDAIMVAGYHVENGARKFSAFSKAMIEDLGEAIKPYLKALYLSVRNWPGFDNNAMNTEAEIELMQGASANSKKDEAKSENHGTREEQQSANSLTDSKQAESEILKAAGLKLKQATTPNGSTVWEVSGNTMQHKDMLKALGGRWYGPKKVWSFYGSDPTSKIEARLKGKETANEAMQDRKDTEKKGANETLSQRLYRAIRDGEEISDYHDLKRVVAEFDGVKTDAVSQLRMKEAQEAYETATVRQARHIVDGGEAEFKKTNSRKQADRNIFGRLLSAYKNQPNLNIRTSTSATNQAYSTPAPIAFLASRLAGIDKSKYVYEPTAGNGMLLIGADQTRSTVVELDKSRAQNLIDLGFRPYEGDATTAIERGDVKPDSVDAVITNPPFGNTAETVIDGYRMGKLEHVIAAKSLAALKDDGKAVLILGANRDAGALTDKERIFLHWLHKHYNVTSHFEIDGKLYSRQGASWPIRVITINGRGQSATEMPGEINRVNTWDNLYEQYEQSLADAEKKHALVSGESDGAAAESSSRGHGGEEGHHASGTHESDANEARNSDREGGTRSANASGKSSAITSGSEGAGASGSDSHVGRDDAATGKDRLEEGTRTEESGRTDRNSGHTEGANATQSDGNALASEENQFQVKYKARSQAGSDDALVPVNMAKPLTKALERIESEIGGDIDQYVADELGYNSTDELHDALMGLQVDSVAAAIYNIEKGEAVIIADQTGIGKGRQAAAIIRYALKTGKVPVFITVKPDLHTDMYNDLHDIGSDDIKPFIFNEDKPITGRKGEELFNTGKRDRAQGMRHITDTGLPPHGRNALFLTYSQINTENAQQEAVSAASKNAIFILDESHNAGGDSNVGKFVSGILEQAKGAVYLSATYAKRPDNMPVYHRTALSKAVDSIEGLVTAMENGGLPLQTIVSSMLTENGQLFRRERSFNGVEIKTHIDSSNRAKHEDISNRATEALRAIVAADRLFHKDFVKEADKQAKKDAKALNVKSGGNKASAGVDHTNFTSTVHNIVRQMLLGLKADTTAEHAIAALKAGEKPVIALENTMGSFLADYAKDNGLNDGDSLGKYDWRVVFNRALERTRRIVVKDHQGNKTEKVVELHELPGHIRRMYDDAQDLIDELEIDIPASPIDWIRHRMQSAGYSIKEITGRKLRVDYTSPSVPTLAKIPSEEANDRYATRDQFNNGKLDAILLNVAGSTGISLHASEKYSDQKKRHMIVAQPMLDINTFVQMLGRIHRTGQVTLPRYTILNVDLPGEKRPTAVLAGKMKKLNANVSSNTDSATSIQSPDLLNKYGDQVVGEYLKETGLDHELDVDADDEAQDVARTATGRLALMPIDVQREFYANVEPEYNALIEYLNKIGRNDLEPATMDLDAEKLSSDILVEGKDHSNPFGQDAVLNEYDARRIGKPPLPEEVSAAVKERLAGKTQWEVGSDLIEEKEKKASVYEQKVKNAITSIEQAAKDKAEAGDHKSIGALALDSLRNQLNVLKELRADFATMVRGDMPIGSAVRLDLDGESVTGVVIDIRDKAKEGGTGNPYAKSKTDITFLVNSGIRTLTVPMSKMFGENGLFNGRSYARIDQAFDPKNAGASREKRFIVTGNLLSAFEEVKGHVISFTDKAGNTLQGILMPKKWSKQELSGEVAMRSADGIVNFLNQYRNHADVSRIGLATKDNSLRITPRDDGSFEMRAAKSASNGGKWWKNSDITGITGDFATQGGDYRVIVPPGRQKAVLEAVTKIATLYAPQSMANIAKPHSGSREFEQSSGDRKALFAADRRGQIEQGNDDYLTGMWKILSNHDEAFQQPASDKKRMEDIVRDIDNKITVDDESGSEIVPYDEEPFLRSWALDMPDGKLAFIREGMDGEVWIDASRLKSGVSRGSSLYNIAATYAHNNGKVFIGDPNGLSAAAVYRRTEAMLSSALKYGTTRHLHPDKRQIRTNTQNSDFVDLTGKIRPLNWKAGQDVHNLRELLKTSLYNTEHVAPEINDIGYNFERQRFERLADGSEFTDSDFKQLARTVSERLGQGELASLTTPYSKADSARGSEDASAGNVPGKGSPFGSATLKRAALTNTLVSEASGEVRGRNVGLARAKLHGGLDTALRKILYAASETRPSAGFSVSDTEKAIADVRAKWSGADIHVVQSTKDLPSSAVPSNISGAYLGNGKIYLVADNIRDADHANEVLAHEAIGHLAAEELLDQDEYKRALNNLILLEKSGNRIVKDLAEQVDQIQPGLSEEDRAKEIAALSVENGQYKNSGALRNAVADIVRGIKNALRNLGFSGKWLESMGPEEIFSMLRSGERKLASGANSASSSMREAPAYASSGAAPVNQTNGMPTGQSVLDELKEGRPVDAIFRGIIQTAQIDKATKKAYEVIDKAITETKFKDVTEPGVKMAINSLLDKARSGLVDRYGLSEEYKDTDQERAAIERKIAMKGAGIVQKLLDSGMNSAEAQVLQAVLEGEVVPDATWKALADPIREAIDELGEQAVDLGLLDRATFEKNRATYLHRVYTVHEAEQSSLGKWVGKRMQSRRRNIIGNQLKGRGMEMAVDPKTLLEHHADWFGKKEQIGSADKTFVGQKFVVMHRVQAIGQGTKQIPGTGQAGRKPRVLERVFLPADKPIPAKYGSWENMGTWEVRDSRGGKYVLWRDFTKEERTRMGQILDARYTIGKTFHMMAHDLSNGWFLGEIAKNGDWTWLDANSEPDPATRLDDPYNMRGGALRAKYSGYSNYEWVKVPDSNVQGTSRKKWGALAGKYVRAEIWRDLNQLYEINRPGVWNTILTQWKLNKTARNPVVHMNNVMSNLVLMDLADVRFRDLYRGIAAMKEGSKDYQEAKEHGAFGSNFVLSEVKRDVLDPLLNDILKQSTNDTGFFESHVGQMGRIVDKLFSAVKFADEQMVNAYQIEDEIFRMATYMRRRSLGDSPKHAARMAREQFIDYDIRAPWINAARATVLPFISYTYRLIPLLSKAIAERPWKLAKYATIAYMVNALGYMLAPGDDDDEKRAMRDHDKGITWLGVPKMLRMGWTDDYGNPVFLDMSGMIPGGNLLDGSDTHLFGAPIPSWMMFGGPLVTAAEMVANKSIFLDKEIYNKKTDSAGEIASKQLGYLWQAYAPSAPWIPGSIYMNKIGEAAMGGKDRSMHDESVAYAAAQSLGIKLKPMDVAMQKQYQKFEFDKILKEYKYQLNELGRDRARNIISESQYNSEKENVTQKINKLADKAKEKFGSQ